MDRAAVTDAVADTAGEGDVVSKVLGSLRRMVLAPSLVDVSFAKLQFPITPSATTSWLEAIPQAVICGFEWAIEGPPIWEIERRLDLVEPERRGFAYEGATMAFTVLDAMGRGTGRRSRDLLEGPGRPHFFLAYIGIGFAMARLPRPLWRKVLPDLTGISYHPTMSWLAVDGYGFDKAYFDQHTWIVGQQRPKPYPWQGRADYFPRAFDQGIGRALWFRHAAACDDVAATIGGFAQQRQADLWSGVGLAAAFAGGCAGEGFGALRRTAGDYADHLAQGAVFAAKARMHAGFCPEHTETALRVLTGMSAGAAAELADDVAVDSHSDIPAYEQWRQAIRAQLGHPSDVRR
jgi:enediyne biosynthesis protein E2